MGRYKEHEVEFVAEVPAKDGLFGKMEKRFRLTIEPDDGAGCDPRTDYDLLGRIYACHSRYNIGHENFRDVEQLYRQMWLDGLVVPEGIPQRVLDADGFCPDYGCTADEDKDIEWNGKWELREDAVILPLSLHDHSATHLYVGRPGCRWDSMRVGYIALSAAQLKKEYGDAPDAVERATKILKSEVQMVDDYMNGRTWWFKLEEMVRVDDEVSEEEAEWDVSGDFDASGGFLGSLDPQDSNYCGIWDNMSSAVGKAAMKACGYRTVEEDLAERLERGACLEDVRICDYREVGLNGEPHGEILVQADGCGSPPKIIRRTNLRAPEGYFFSSCWNGQYALVDARAFKEAGRDAMFDRKSYDRILKYDEQRDVITGETWDGKVLDIQELQVGPDNRINVTVNA